MKKVLLTGFEPFGGDSINPALEVINELSAEKIPGVELIVLQIPVVFGKAFEVLTAKIVEEKPDLILSIGQSGGSVAISIERVGINIDDARMADNEGNTPEDEAIVPDGPAAIFTTINTRETVTAIKNAGIPVELSYSAGTYVCNNLTYGTLYFLETSKINTKYGFIHVPFLPQQATTKKIMIPPSMSLDTMKQAIKIAIAVNLK
ncbi:MAG: pyroglutamyl-peptidase I [Asgard group archaeon]|nr:pyroglutamyl-peptidase I [Asgard group archaeon]